jgi:acyl-CoA synthetase (AMP-forming)/AMP-acid ligase II
MRIDQIIQYHAVQRPDTLALTLDASALSYAGLNSRACKVAHGLLAEGIGPGDRVAILGENSIDHVVLMLAAGKIGAVTVAINYRLAGPELQYVIDDCEARLLVVPDAQFVSAVAALDLIHKPVLLGTADHLPDSWRDWDDWWQGRADHEPQSVTVAEHALLQLYTSGTTGRPKGAVISHRNLLDLSYAGLVAAEQRLNIGDNELVIAPLFHIGAVASLFYTLMIGVNVILHRNFNPAAVVDAIERHRLSSMFMVPAMLQAILNVVPDLQKRDFSTLKRINYGASPIGETLLRQAMTVFGCDFQQSYGMTETSGAVAQLTATDHRRALAGRPELLRSCGRQNAAAILRVVDDEGNTVPDGQLGEIAVMSSTVMLEYWKQPQQTAKAIRHGWLHTGDIGYRDSEGYFFLLDRKNDVVISGGENIYPNEVERALLLHEAIADVAVIGVPSEKYGEALLAVCVLRSGAALDEEALVAHCRQHLAGYKVPRQYIALEALPRNPSGKVLRTELRKSYWQDSGRRIG